MATNRTRTYNVSNNTSKTIEGTDYAQADSWNGYGDVVVSYTINMNSSAGGWTSVTVDDLHIQHEDAGFYGNDAYLGHFNVYGGAGNDTFKMDGPISDAAEKTDWETSINMGAGNDYVWMNSSGDMYGSDLIYLGDGDDYAETGDRRDTVHGGNGNDTIKGGDDHDMLIGNAGNDNLDGGIWNDTLYGGDGNDLLVDGDGDDALYGGNQNDSLYATKGKDKIYGESGDDKLIATVSYENVPTLVGGDGKDLFQLDIGLKRQVTTPAPSTDWGLFTGGTTAGVVAGTAFSSLNAVALAVPAAYSPIVSMGLAVGGSLLSRFIQDTGLKGTTVEENLSQGSFIYVEDFDPRFDTVEIVLPKTNSSISGSTVSLPTSLDSASAIYSISDANAVRAQIHISQSFLDLFRPSPGAAVNYEHAKSALDAYINGGIKVTKDKLISGGTEISNTYLSQYGVSISDFAVPEDREMYVFGSFAGHSFSAPSNAPVRVGTASSDVLSAEVWGTYSNASTINDSHQVTLHGAGGSDVLIGATHRDLLNGGAEDDVLFGLGGIDTLTGGAGNDVFHVLTSCLDSYGTSNTPSVTNSRSDFITDFDTSFFKDQIYVDDTAVWAKDVSFTASGYDILISFAGRPENTVTLQDRLKPTSMGSQTTLADYNLTATDVTANGEHHVVITGNYTGPACFITTATAEQFGWADDCTVLKVLRWFRDNVMEKRPDWKADIETYYRIAPQIVEATRHDRKLYRDLWTRSLRKAVAAVVAGKYQRAYDIYRKMVDDLAARYLPAGERV